MFPSSFANDPFFKDHGFPDSGSLVPRTRQEEVGQLFPFPNFNETIANMERSFGEMRRFMEDNMTHGMQMSTSDGNGQSFYQSSSVYSYRKDKDGQPEVYEAHHSNRHAPGGVREERKALRDSRKKVEKMAVGRHIGDRGHVIEKSRDMGTQHVTQHQNLIGLREDDVDAYHREWQEKTRDWHRPGRGLAGNDGHSDQRALGYKPEKHVSRRSKF